MMGPGFISRLGRRLRGEGSPGRFIEQRQQGHRAGRRLDSRFIAVHQLRLLRQGGALFFNLLKLPGLHVQAPQPDERGLDLVPFLSRSFERLDEPGVLRLQAGDGGFVDARVLAGEELLK